jgi:hypothetical protein
MNLLTSIKSLIDLVSLIAHDFPHSTFIDKQGLERKYAPLTRQWNESVVDGFVSTDERFVFQMTG